MSFPGKLQPIGGLANLSAGVKVNKRSASFTPIGRSSASAAKASRIEFDESVSTSEPAPAGTNRFPTYPETGLCVYTLEYQQFYSEGSERLKKKKPDMKRNKLRKKLDRMWDQLHPLAIDDKSSANNNGTAADDKSSGSGDTRKNGSAASSGPSVKPTDDKHSDNGSGELDGQNTLRGSSLTTEDRDGEDGGVVGAEHETLGVHKVWHEVEASDEDDESV
ncbi:hypothetical protein Rhopal_002531-T1 [Rhodotorula paludigena]|uniref:Uncharacterized protein n=1 Tax=Rhodotorula paludigena TaxID=86838 RepID=A0AAV5GG32_9BASI|nr:hypothetical protein Rhopal_002531-T1 [Rhodotorula paludigena]